MIYFQYLLIIMNSEKLTEKRMKKIPQAQMEIKDYKDSILPARFTLG